MKYRLLDTLVCPACRSQLRLEVLAARKLREQTGVPQRHCTVCFFGGPSVPQHECRECYQHEITDGMLSCSCGMVFPIIDSVPIMLLSEPRYFHKLRQKYPENIPLNARPEPQDAPPRGVADAMTRRRFGFEWSRYPTCLEDEEENIFFEETQLEPHMLRDRLTLDAGCGMGRFTRIAGKQGGEVIGIDLSESVFTAAQVTGHLPAVHIVLGDILKLPFRSASFDIVYSLGVLHHTPNTQRSFAALAKTLKKGGVCSMWVYGTAGKYKDFATNPLRPDRAKHITSPLRFKAYWLLVLLRETLSNAIRTVTVRCPHRLLYALCYLLALTGKIPLVKYTTFSAHRDWRVRLLENFDWLAPPFQHHHTKEEVSRWFAQEGITVSKILRHGFIPKVGITGIKL